jgi:hypothetical protein
MALFLSRNISTCDSIEDKIWKKIREHEYISEYISENRDVFLMVASYAFTKSKHDRKQLIKRNPNGGWLKDLSTAEDSKGEKEEAIDNAITLMLAVAVDDSGGLNILDEPVGDIQLIAEEYANAGAEDFYELILNSESADTFYKELFEVINNN